MPAPPTASSSSAPTQDIGPLDEAAERFDLDAEALRAAARAALAAPDREIRIEVGKDLEVAGEAQAA